MNGFENPDTETLIECIPTMKPIDLEVEAIDIFASSNPEANWLGSHVKGIINGRYHYIPVQPDFARQISPGDTVRITVEHIPPEPEPESEEDPES